MIMDTHTFCFSSSVIVTSNGTGASSVLFADQEKEHKQPFNRKITPEKKYLDLIGKKVPRNTIRRDLVWDCMIYFINLASLEDQEPSRASPGESGIWTKFGALQYTYKYNQR